LWRRLLRFLVAEEVVVEGLNRSLAVKEVVVEEIIEIFGC